MQLYDGAFDQLIGTGGDWSLTGRTFRLLLLEAGGLSSLTSYTTVAAILAPARNTAASTERPEITVTFEINDYGVRKFSFNATEQASHVLIREHGGAAVIYEAGAADATSYPIGLLRYSETLGLVNGAGVHKLIPGSSLEGTSVLRNGGLAISATAEKFKTTNTWYATFGGIQFSNAAEDNLVFTAAHTVNTGSATGFFFGAILVQGVEAGTISTKVVSADQVFATAAAAVAALPQADALNVALGHILIAANEDVPWTGNTSDMTDASDCLTATFVDYGPDA